MVGWTKRDPDLENWTSYLTAGLLTLRAFNCLFLLLRFMRSFLSWGGWLLLGGFVGVQLWEGCQRMHVCTCEHTHVHISGSWSTKASGRSSSTWLGEPSSYPRTLGASRFPPAQPVNLFDNKDIIGNIGGLCSRLFYLVFKNLKGIFANIFYVWAPGFWHLVVTWITETLAPYF